MPRREIDIDAFGQALLEEILFRGGQEVSACDPGDPLEVALTVRLRADAEQDRLEIEIPTASDDLIVTHLDRPF